MAPYGILQSLLDEKLLSATLKEVHRVMTRNGIFGLELVADLPAWDEYSKRTSLRGKRGPNGKPIALIESVKQDRRNHITRFEQEFVEGRGKSATRKKFTIAFRTALGPADGAAAGKSRIGSVGAAGRLPGRPVGPAGRGLDHPGPGEGRGW